ncbi:hypothetical protein DIC78_18460 [Bacillus halotolerans]|nr:hypothetical protein DIC78_18460 [Bacillus halotolerans]
MTGSLLGVVASILALGIAYLDLFFHLIRYFDMTSDLLVGAWGSLIFSCIGFTASIVVLFKRLVLLNTSILMIIPGIMVIVRKGKTAPKSV